MDNAIEAEQWREEINKLVNEKLASIYRQKENLIEAWLAKTGLPPDACCLVQQQNGNIIRFWIETKADRCTTHQAEIIDLTEKLRLHKNRLELLVDAVASEKIDIGISDKLSEVLDRFL